jgi:hypothetical protein
MEAFVQKTFTKDWNWHSEKRHQKYLRWLLQKSASVLDHSERRYYKQLYEFAKRERQYYRKRLETKFKCSRQGMLVSIKYRKSDNTFFGVVKFRTKQHDRPTEEFNEASDDSDQDTTESLVASETVVLETEWVRETLLPEMVDHIMRFDSGDGFFNIPQTETPVLVMDKPIQRVRYVPEQTRFVPDVTAKNKFTKKIIQRRTRVLAETIVKPLPKKEIIVHGYWLARLSDGTTMNVAEGLLIDSFGKNFIDEVRSTQKGFVDVPVGEFKISRLHLYPHLYQPGAPRVQFIQSDGKDLCVSKALASVFYALNFREEALKIDNYGEEIIRGNVVDALKKVSHYAQTVLPSWIQVTKMPLLYDWKNHLQDSETILLGVLSAADGHRNHCIALHSSYIYDANELLALPLNSDALDYCTSTEDRKSSFLEFRKGYLFAYKGNKSQRRASMQLQYHM